MDAGVILGIIGIFISVVAFVMAIPPIFQMFFGRPKLFITVEEAMGAANKSFLASIKNEKLESKFLRWLGVRRDMGEVMCSFDIIEIGTNRLIARGVPADMYSAPTGQDGLLVRALPAFHVGATLFQVAEGAAGFIDGLAKKAIPISPGDYSIIIGVICGEDVYKVGKNIKITDNPNTSFWA